MRNPASDGCAQPLEARGTTFSTLLELTKFRISAASAFTGAAGYLAFRRAWDFGLISTLGGILLLAMAASAFNEVQEHDLDALMERTRRRPIPRGSISVPNATLFAVLLALAGFNLLLWIHGWTPALLGLLAVLWYNGLYTPLKRVSAFAVVPGSVIGSLPPAIGWTAAGGMLGSPALFGLAFLLFIWQVPHFWLLALMHHKDYDKAAFPTLFDHFDEFQIRRLIFTWTCATIASTGILPYFQTVSRLPAMILIAAGGLGLLVRSASLLRSERRPRQLFKAFMDINTFALIVMAAVILDAFQSR